MYIGAAIGCLLAILLVFLAGFGAWLALASGMATVDTNPNL
jgi:hypothetical protein